MDALEQHYQLLESQESAKDAAQYLGYRPTGWYFAFDTNKNPVGLGYFCDRCKLTIDAHAPETLRCCGKKIKQPNLIGRLTLPKFFIKAVGTRWTIRG